MFRAAKVIKKCVNIIWKSAPKNDFLIHLIVPVFPFFHFSFRFFFLLFFSFNFARLLHKPSGRTYHTEFNPPKVAMTDDVSTRSRICFCVIRAVLK